MKFRNKIYPAFLFPFSILIICNWNLGVQLTKSTVNLHSNQGQKILKGESMKLINIISKNYHIKALFIFIHFRYSLFAMVKKRNERWKCLTLSMLGKHFSRRHLIFFLIFLRNRLWYFMQIVSLAWNISAFFLGKIRKVWICRLLNLLRGCWWWINIIALFVWGKWIYTICLWYRFIIILKTIEFWNA